MKKTITIVMIFTMLITPIIQGLTYKRVEAFTPSLAARTLFHAISKTTIKTLDNPTSLNMARAGVGAMAIGSYYALEEALGSPQSVAGMPDWVKVTVGAGLMATGADLVIDLYNNLVSTNSNTVPLTETYDHWTQMPQWNKSAGWANSLWFPGGVGSYKDISFSYSPQTSQLVVTKAGQVIETRVVSGAQIAAYYPTTTGYHPIGTLLLISSAGSTRFNSRYMYTEDSTPTKITTNLPVLTSSISTQQKVDLTNISPSTPIEIIVPAGALNGTMTESQINSAIVNNQDVIRQRVDEQAKIRKEAGIPITNPNYNPSIPYNPATNPAYIPQPMAGPVPIPTNPEVAYPVGDIPIGLEQGYIQNPYFDPTIPADNLLNPPYVWNPALPVNPAVPYVMNPAFNPAIPRTIENPVVIPNQNHKPQEPLNLSLPQLMTTKFPFSLPFDFKHLLDLLIVPKQRPNLDIAIDSDIAGIPLKFNLKYDFTAMDIYMEYFRWFMIIGFGFVLIYATPKLVGGAEK